VDDGRRLAATGEDEPRLRRRLAATGGRVEAAADGHGRKNRGTRWIGTGGRAEDFTGGRAKVSPAGKKMDRG